MACRSLVGSFVVPWQSARLTLRSNSSKLVHKQPLVISMGFEKVVQRQGDGPRPLKGQKVTVHCTGYGKNRDLSKKFWSTKDPGQTPFEFSIGLGQVIKGWDEGVMSMQLGEIALIKCTPDYAYGKGGFQAWGIEPDSPLNFEIEVLSIK